MKRPFWTKVDLTSFPAHRRNFAPDVQRVLVMTALTTVVVAFVALLMETRRLRREVGELREIVLARPDTNFTNGHEVEGAGTAGTDSANGGEL